MKPHDLVIDFFRSLARHVIRHPWRVLGIAGLVTLAAAPGIGRLKLRTDGYALVPQNAPEVIYDKTIRAQFGIEDNIVVWIRSNRAEGIFNPATLQLVRDLTSAFARLPGLGASNLMSLATETSFRFRPGALVLQTLLEPPLTTKTELDQLREDLHSIGLYNGTLISADAHSTAILIGIPDGTDTAFLYRKVQAVIAANQSAQDEIAVTGAPIAESLLGFHILEDLGVPQTLLGTGTRGRVEKNAWTMPANFYDLRLLVARWIGLVPMAILVMMLVLWASFRNWLAILAPLPGIMATLLFVFGWMGWLGVPVYLTIVVMPVLLVVTGVTNDIYLFNRYFTLLQEKPGMTQVELIHETFDKLTPPVISTSLATAIAFLSFGFSPLEPVRAFGLCAGAGVMFSFFCSLTVVPALLTLLKPAWLASSRQIQKRGGQLPLITWFTQLGPMIVRRRWWIISMVLLVTALTPIGLCRLTVQDSWTGGFDPRSDFSRVTRQVNEQFFGIHLLFVSCDALQQFKGEIPGSALTPGRIFLPGNFVPDDAYLPGSAVTIFSPESLQSSNTNLIWQTCIEKAVRAGTNLVLFTTRSMADLAACQPLAEVSRLRFEILAQSQLDPQIIRAIDDFGAFIRTRVDCGVGGVLDAADYLRTTRFLLRPEDANAKILPAGAEEAKVLWDYYRFARGPFRLRQAMNAGYTRSLTTVFLKDANFVDTAKLMSDLRAYAREHLAPLGIKIGFAGDVAVSQTLIHSIVITQLQSLCWSLVGIFAVTAFFGGSLRWGFFCLLPSLLAVLIKFAVMGWADIPLGVATSMFAAMTLGIGVNCAIHLLEGCRQARAAGASQMDVLNRALRLTGPPALINTLAMSLGFGVLMLSQVPANARLGLLLVLGLVNCFVISLLLLPVLLNWWPLDSKNKVP